MFPLILQVPNYGPNNKISDMAGPSLNKLPLNPDGFEKYQGTIDQFGISEAFSSYLGWKQLVAIK